MLEKKYGKDWRKGFKNEVDIEVETEKKISALLDEIDYIKKKQTDLERECNRLQPIMFPVANTTKYNVFIAGWGKLPNGEYEWLTFYTLIIDYRTGSVQVLNDER